jgi:TP901 family phage tail tape measure protein
MDAGSVVVRIMADSTALTAGLTKASGEMAAFGKKMSAVGAGMTKYMTVPLVAVGAVAVKMAADYQTSLTKIRSLTGASTKQVTKWSSEIQKWSGVVGQTPKQLAEGLYFIASSGLKGAKAMDALKISSTAAALGMGETQTIADYATSAIGAYGQKVMTASKAVDILTAAVQYGKGEPEQFAGALGMVTGTAAALNISLGDVVGSISAMTLKGLDVPEATTALNNLMMTTIKGAKEGSTALDKYGLSYKDVRDSFANKGVLQTLELLDKAFGGNVETMGAVFGNVRSMRAVMQLLKGDYAKTAEVIDNVRHSQGALNEAWGKGKDDPTLQFKRSLAELSTAAIKIGTDLLPTVVSAAKWVGNLARSFSGLSEGTRGFVVKAAVVVAALGPLVAITGRLISLLTTLRVVSFFSGIIAAIPGAVAGMQLLVTETNAGRVAMMGMQVSSVAALGAIGVAAGALALELNHIHNQIEEANAQADAASDQATQNINIAGAKMMASKAEQEITRITAAIADNSMTVKQGQTAMGGWHRGLMSALKAARHIGDEKMVAQIQGLMGRAKALAGQKWILPATEKQVGSFINQWIKLGKNVKFPKLDMAQTTSAIGTVNGKIKDLQTYLGALKRQKQTVSVKAETKQATSQLKAAERLRDALVKKKAQLQLGVNGDAFDQAVKAATAKATAFGKLHPTVKLSADTSAALSGISTLSTALSNLPTNKTITLTTVTKTIEHALGGVFTTPHVGMVAEAGPEAIIPLSNPARAAQVMAQAGLSGTGGSATGLASSAASTATRVARSVADAISRGVGGLKGKRAKRLTQAADTSGAIGTLVDFVSSVSDALAALEKTTATTLSAGWQDKVKAIVKTADKLAAFIAAQINKAFPWSKGKAKTKNREAVDPKLGKKGQSVQHAAEMTGPIGELVSFISEMSDALTTVASSTIPALTDGMKTKVQQIAQAAATMATVISAELAKAFPKAKTTGKGKRKKTTGGESLADLLAASEISGDVGNVLGVMSDTISILTAMTEADPRLFEVPANAFTRLASIISNMVATISASLATLTIPDAVLAAADKLKTLAEALQSVVNLVSSAQSSGANGWSDVIGAANAMTRASGGLTGSGSAALAYAGSGALGGGDYYQVSVSIDTVNASTPGAASEASGAIATAVITKLAHAKRATRRSTGGAMTR